MLKHYTQQTEIAYTFKNCSTQGSASIKNNELEIGMENRFVQFKPV